MKTTVKTILTVLTFATQSAIATAQNQEVKNSVWVTVNDINAVPATQANGRLFSNDQNFQQLIEQFDIFSCTQAFPASRKTHLQKVYELECNCNEAELISSIKKSTSTLSQPENGPDYELLYEPNDYNLAFSNDYALDLINASEAWDITPGDQDVEIAITDSNFDLNHEELAGTTTYVQSTITATNYYHGTAVAITAAGNTNNALGKSSIGSNCMLQLYNMGYNNLLQACYNGAKIINASWYSSCVYTQYGQDVIDEIYEYGAIVVVSAGNGNATCGSSYAYAYPAAFNHVISVSSIGPNDNHEGVIGDPASAHQHNDSVDICAPGYNVALTVSSGWYLTGNGTSFAAPYVSGTIGLMLSINPCLTFEQIEEILYSTAADVDSLNPQYAGLLGAGRLDAGAAVLMASEYSTINIDVTQQFNCSTKECTFTASSSDPNQGLLFVWNDQEDGTTFTTNESGTITVYVDDEKGCFGMDTFNWSAPEALNTNTTKNDPTCQWNSNGSISIEIEGGVEAYNILWSTGDTTNSIQDLSAGIYSVVVTDQLGCEDTATITLTEPAAIEVSFEVTCSGETNTSGSVDMTVTGGTPDYTFVWNNNESVEDLYNVASGSYTVQITDANGCQKEETVVVENCQLTAAVTEFDEINMNVYPNPSNGATVTINTNSENVDVEIYNINGQLITFIPAGNSTVTVDTSDLPAGVYNIRCSQDNTPIATEKLVVL